MPSAQWMNRRRRNDIIPNRQAYNRLSQLLRALGDHLDQSQVSAFQISWSQDSALLTFNSLDDESDSRTFTADKLQQLGSHSRFRRSSGTHAGSQNTAFEPDQLTIVGANSLDAFYSGRACSACYRRLKRSALTRPLPSEGTHTGRTIFKLT